MSPYLSRLAPEDYVEGRRRQLYSEIFSAPGVSFTELRDRTNIRFGVLQYHLETLERAGIVESVKAGRFRRYFPTGSDDHKALALRAQAADPEYLRMMVDVESAPGSTNQDVHGLHPDVTRQSVGYRLGRLESAGALKSRFEGRKRRFFLTPEGARALEVERQRGLGNGHCPPEDFLPPSHEPTADPATASAAEAPIPTERSAASDGVAVEA